MKKSPRTAVVTGASAGIGREIVVQLVKNRGVTVLATARRLDRLEALAAELPPGSVHVLAGDLADAAFRARLWEHAESVFPEGIDLLVNNAGLGNYSEFSDQDPEAWRSIVEVNIMALLDLSAQAIRHMKPRKTGQILEISSILGFVAIPYSAVYVATKHAVNGLVKALDYELRGTGVRVWAACPGRTESEFASVALGGPAAPGSRSRGEPTDRIVRSILHGLDRRSLFLLPSPTAWLVVTLAHWLPAPFHWIMRIWSPSFFRREINRG